MRVRKPITSGKLILNYNGSRTELQTINAKFIRISAVTIGIINGIQENLIVRLELFDTTKIILCLGSNTLYISSSLDNKISYIVNDNNYFYRNTIIIDKELAIIIGCLIYTVVFGNENIEERYNFEFIFQNPDEIYRIFKTKEIEFEDYT